ncbi:MAG: hypothetical protein C5B50_03955 [Verrucomicrobia bacterium]|nr:MAG: hypothetical protein C5B50_03955 [Verrucomicrobiota bacterium]
MAIICLLGQSELCKADSPTAFPILTNAEQVHRLTREEAAGERWAKIRGVVTCPLPQYQAVVIQDSTRGIYVSHLDSSLGAPPAMGDLMEIEGVTDPGQFAPHIRARSMKRLGAGELPQPVHPSWDQLINGSLDTQYVEIEGIVTSTRTNQVTLLTHGGRIRATLGETNMAGLTQYEDSLVHVRGCLFATWDAVTHQVKVGEIRFLSPSLTVREPAPQDVFATGLKRVSDLLLFDPQASALRRVKVRGQIVYEREGEYYLMDGPNGLRFLPKEASNLRTGDQVEVVGFPSLIGPSPVLREAAARRTGAAALPPPRRISAGELFEPRYDATRVQVQAVVLSLNADQETLEMQAGLRRFLARLKASRSPLQQTPIGSQLELTGVCAGRGGSPTAGGQVDSLELLLDSPGDVRVLARPPWWTLRRLLVLVAALAGVLVGALVWIRLLRHQVQERATQLQNEIRERERAEHQRTLAQERARIARDLHDDLGSSLTEIGMLATPGPGSRMPSEEASERLGVIAGKSHSMVHALDEIVWAIDPQRDTLGSAIKYLASYVEEFVSGSNVPCRVQIPNSFPEQVVSGEVRHQLFLAVKETLNNVVRHAGATEITFRVQVSEDRIQISISDNGVGFAPLDSIEGNGLSNLRTRLTSLGGQCEIQSSPRAGTTVLLALALPIPARVVDSTG